MRFKLIAAALVATLVIGGAAIAKNVQGKKFSPEKRQKIERKIVKELNLSDQQVRELRPIVMQYEQQVKTVWQSNLPKDQKRAQIKSIREQEKAAVSQKLSPEQMKKAEAMWAKFQRGHRFHKALAQLNLTDNQKATIKGIFQSAKTEAKAIKSSTSMDKATKQARMQALRKETRERVLSALTPDQRARLDSMKRAHHA